MMKGKNSDIEELSKLISNNFLSLSSTNLISKDDIKNIEELKKYLSSRIKFLLEEKFDLLVNLLYRIDINDKKLEEVFTKERKDNIPDSIAELVIERELQKIYYRKKFEEGNL